MRRLLPALLAFLPLAGCLQGGPPTPPPPAVDVWCGVNAAMAGVPCQATFGGDPAASTPNLKLLATLPLPAVQQGLHTDLEVRSGLALHARRAGGFDVHSVANPLRPARLGTFLHDAAAPTVAFSPDNRTALLGTPAGIVLVDLSDPTDPVRV
ncbi:MAG TPA: hypothetical protein VHI93_04190, partial [Candidatus Thermoplasmatota archaeon]|nr:hypothetical protein [Candidatus Thermoplasmatota archaeon]